MEGEFPATSLDARSIDAVDEDGVLRTDNGLFDEEGRRLLTEVMREIGRELQGDGMLVTSRDAAGATMILFADGACTPQSEAESDMLAFAASADATDSGGPRSQWRPRSDRPAEAMLTTAMPFDGVVVNVTTLFRRVGASTRMQASQTTGRLLPLVGPFFELWMLRLGALVRLRGLTAALDRSDVATLLIGHDGGLVFANAAANRLLEERDGMRRKGMVLTGNSSNDTLRLHAAIEEAAAAGQDGAPSAALVALRRSGRRSLMASVVATGEPQAHGQGAAAIVYVVDPDKDMQTLLEPACHLYGLSRVEARLACLLANGLSLAESARRMRVRELTARGYLKQVFLKTETARQVELVRLMLASSIRCSTGAGDRVA